MSEVRTPVPAGSAGTSRAGSGFQIAGSAAERYEQAAGVFMLGWSEDLVDRAGVSVGDRVVDLACGTGFVTRVAAARAGRRGRAIGVDVNETMVAEARRVTGLQIIEASAAATGLSDAECDVVLCQQGLQYVPDPGAVLREAHRLLRGGGRIAVSVWSDFERNPFRAGQLEAMRPHLTDAVAQAFEGTSASALGGPAGMAGGLRDAGFVDVVVEERVRQVDLPPIRSYFPVLIAATPWKEIYEQLSDPERDAVLERLDAWVDHRPGGGCSVTMTAATATGRRVGPVPGGR